MAIPDDAGVLRTFRNKKLVVLNQLMTLLRCAAPTVRRRLKKWKALTSFNRNGRYYTLPDVPEFDHYGIWRCRNVFFSKHGNLKQTVKALVDRSTAGLNCFELSKQLGLPIHSFISHFNEEMLFRREKLQGLSIYYSSKPGLCKKQMAERLCLYREKAKLELPTDAESVVLLVALVKHPDSSPDKLQERVRRKGVLVAVDRIQNLLNFHGLQKKSLL